MATQRQNQIIEESIKIIAQDGIQDLTIKKISQKIGISEPAIYRHFKNKMAILSGILKKFEDNANDMLKSTCLDTHLPARDKLRKIFIGRCVTFAEKPYMATVIFAEEIFRFDENLKKTVKKIMQTHQSAIKKILDQMKRTKQLPEYLDPENISIMLLGSLRLLMTKWRLADCEFDLETKGKKVWNCIESVLFRE